MSFLNPPPLSYTFNRLQDRVIFVTGASSGIGAAATRLFAKEGAKVVAASRRLDKIEAVVAELQADGLEAVAVACDVTDESSIEKAIQFTVDTYGRLDGAFNNAGLGTVRCPIHEIDMERFDSVLATNLRGVVMCMKHEIRCILKTSKAGSIVNTSSIGGLIGGANNGIYAASKWGLAGLTKCAALDYARKGIRVNAIAPGPTRSEMFDNWMPDDEAREQLAELFPIKYIAEPDDMARSALFLFSDESRWTTGIVLPCEGGKSV